MVRPMLPPCYDFTYLPYFYVYSSVSRSGDSCVDLCSIWLSMIISGGNWTDLCMSVADRCVYCWCFASSQICRFIWPDVSDFFDVFVYLIVRLWSVEFDLSSFVVWLDFSLAYFFFLSFLWSCGGFFCGNWIWNFVLSFYFLFFMCLFCYLLIFGKWKVR